MSTRHPERDASATAGATFGFYVVALAICLVGNLAIRMGERGGWLPREAQIGAAILTAAPLAVAAVLFWRMLKRDLDEMLQRVLLEGLAFALVVYVPLAALYVNLRTVAFLAPRLDPPDVLLLPAFLVALGVALAWRRFR